MSNSESKPTASRALPTLPFVPQKQYNFEHTVVQEAPVRAAIVLWNLVDFAHVNWIHRRNYKYCKVLAESGRVSLLEYGVKYFFFLPLPISIPVIMWHSYTPNRVQHLSRTPWGGYTKVDVRLEEFERDGKTYTRLTHSYFANLPGFLSPFKRLFERYLESWSERLWQEDNGMMLRRQQVIDCGFKDHPLDTNVKAVEGF